MRKLLGLSLFIAIMIISITLNAQEVSYKLTNVGKKQDSSALGGRYTSINSNSASVNLKGETVFIGTNEETANTQHIFAITKHNAFVVASGNMKSPAGGVYTSFASPVVND